MFGVTQRLVETLQAARPVEAVLPLLPAESGVYAWWHTPGALPDVPGTPHPTDAVELLYVGIAPDEPKEGKPPSKSTLRSRVRENHLRNDSGKSTLRRALAAFLWQSHGWHPTQARTKVKLSLASERELTAWMRANLSLAFVEHPTPWSVEPGLIVAMRPPLNWKHNEGHPFRAELKRAGEAFRSAGRESAERGA